MEENARWREKFSAFPYEPYPIQIDFMNSLYDSLDKGGVAMLESPTGTGKTLSIICSALQWVVDQRLKTNNDSSLRSVSDDEPDWMRDFDQKKRESKIAAMKAKKPSKLGTRLGNFGAKNCNVSGIGLEKKRSDVLELDEEEEFLVEDYGSEEEAIDLKRKACGSFSSSEEEEEDEEEEKEEVLKVYFCSRTHSQLSQFVKELKKTKFDTDVNAVCLGSRKNSCINEDVLKLGSSTRINERCLELLKNKNQEVSKIKIRNDGGRIRQTKASSGCPMLRKQKLQKKFRDEVHELGALDIEDLVQLGRKIGTCPYYGSRSIVPAANLVVLPYQSLLLKSSRESLGLNLENSVVIIDEAHNLADALTNMYNSKITLSQLDQVHLHLKLYLDRFQNQLGAGNRRYIQTLMVITRAFRRLLLVDVDVKIVRGERACASSITINDFLFSLDIDNINLVKLQRYIKESKIAHKVSGYGDKILSLQRGSTLDNGGNEVVEGSILSGFQAFADILLSLANNDTDGRIIVSRTPPSGQHEERFLKYVMLAGDKLFNEIVEQAHAVVLAGGTLQPVEEAKERLFPSLSPDRFYFFSCNHIIPPESILPIAVPVGPTGRSFDFSYNSRSSMDMIEELGRLVCNLVGIVPEGIVIFFSSFEYEAQVYDAWKSSDILARIMKKKQLFREPRSNAEVEVVLKNYKEAISLLSTNSREIPQQNGALLLAVVGGKMSEGINFSDGMGRCVVMIGLPYPSLSDIELVERIKHIEGLKEPSIPGPDKLAGNEICNESAVRSAFDILRSCKKRGREYYENLCMKAVNQSIGRVIRHIGDYAAILLVDTRYASNSSKWCFSHPTSKLPQWIKNSLVSAPEHYGEIHRMLHQFFKLNRQRGCQ